MAIRVILLIHAACVCNAVKVIGQTCTYVINRAQMTNESISSVHGSAVNAETDRMWDSVYKRHLTYIHFWTLS